MNEKIELKELKDVLSQNYINYATSILLNRTLPDLTDGFKPIHRRILFGMLKEKATTFTKVAKLAGYIMGNLHPHGESISSSIVRMGQDFSLNIPLIEKAGNWGAINGSPAAAARYIEGKLHKITEDHILADLYKDAVDWVPNYLATEDEPVTLPVKFNQLLVNGAFGIATGFATNIPPHNLKEVCEGTIFAIEELLKGNGEKLTTEKLLKYIKGPDFPTGGVLKCNNLAELYTTGKGSYVLQAKIDVVSKNELNITEIPYMSNTSNLVDSINDAVEIIPGISRIIDSTTITPSILIKLKSGNDPEIIKELLYRNTTCSVSRPFSLIGTLDNSFYMFSLLDSVLTFINYRLETLKRIYTFSLDKINDEIHKLEGIIIALLNIDEVIKIIRGSNDEQEARKKLINKFKLSDIQTQYILDIRLARLTKMEKHAIETKIEALETEKARFITLLSDDGNIYKEIIDEQKTIIKLYGAPRKTQILEGASTLETPMTKIVDNEQYYLILTKKNFIKKVPARELEGYTQRRGGVGKTFRLRDDDSIINFRSCNNHDYLFIFTKDGMVYRINAWELTEDKFDTGSGKPLSSIVNIQDNQLIADVVSIPMEVFENSQDASFLFITRDNKFKRVLFKEFSRMKNVGIIATRLNNDDTLIRVETSYNDNDTLMLISDNHRYVKIPLKDIRPILRPTYGRLAFLVKERDEIKLADAIVIPATVTDEDYLLIVTGSGKSKLSLVNTFPDWAGASIVMNKAKDKEAFAGSLDFIPKTLLDDPESEVMIVTKFGKFIKIKLSEFKIMSRSSIGVNTIKIKDDEIIAVI